MHVVAFDYQGYGLSEGEPSESACYQDLACVVDYVNRALLTPNRNIYLVGQSLGTGVVIDYVSKRDCQHQ